MQTSNRVFRKFSSGAESFELEVRDEDDEIYEMNAISKQRWTKKKVFTLFAIKYILYKSKNISWCRYNITFYSSFQNTLKKC